MKTFSPLISMYHIGIDITIWLSINTENNLTFSTNQNKST